MPFVRPGIETGGIPLRDGWRGQRRVLYAAQHGPARTVGASTVLTGAHQARLDGEAGVAAGLARPRYGTKRGGKQASGSGSVRCAGEIGDVTPENPDVSRFPPIARCPASPASAADHVPRPAGNSALPLPGPRLKYPCRRRASGRDGLTGDRLILHDTPASTGAIPTPVRFAGADTCGAEVIRRCRDAEPLHRPTGASRSRLDRGAGTGLSGDLALPCPWQPQRG